MNRAERLSLIVLISLAVLCALALVGALVRRPDSLLFYVGPVVVLGLMVLVLRLGTEARIGAALTVVSLGVAVGGAEIALFLTNSSHYRQTLDFEVERVRTARGQGAPYDLRTRLEVVDDLNAQGMPVVAPVTPTAFRESDGIETAGGRVYPLTGMSRAQTVVCNESGEWILIETDEHGFRNPVGLHQPGDVDVVVIGDSYAFGTCVAPGEEVGALLRRSGRRVLSLAHPGNGPLIELAVLEEYAKPLMPHTVLWLYWEGNDLLNLQSESQSVELMKYLDPGHSQGLVDRQPEVDGLLRTHHDAVHEQATATRSRRWRCVVLLCGVRALAARVPASSVETVPVATPGAGRDERVEMLGQVLRSARDRVAAWGGDFRLVYLTGWSRYSLDTDEDGYALRRQVLDEIAESDIELADFHEVLGSHPDPLSLFPFRSRAHYSRDGYALLADFLEERLDESLEERRREPPERHSDARRGHASHPPDRP